MRTTRKGRGTRSVKILREKKATRGRGRRLVERMRGRATSGMSTDEIMALTRGES